MSAGAVIRLGRPTTRTTFQFVADIPLSGSGPGIPLEILSTVLRWHQDKFPERLPDVAALGASFDIEVPDQKITGISIPEEGIWSVRIFQLDAPSPFGEQPAVPGRTWTTETAFRRREESIRFGMRVVCSSQSYCKAPIQFTRPKLILDLASTVGLSDVRSLDGLPWHVEEDQVDSLRELLESPRRMLPVIVLSPLSLSDERYSLDAVSLSKSLQGLAHVACLRWNTGVKWSGLVSKAWSVYRGAIRTYRPGMSFEEDSPYNHPLYVKERIENWSSSELDSSLRGVDAFKVHLKNQCFADGAFRHMSWGDLLFSDYAKARKAERDRSLAREDGEWRELFQSEIEALKSKITALEADCEAFNNDAIAAQNERDIRLEDARRLRILNDALRAAVTAKTGVAVDTGTPIPSSYDEMEEWVGRYLAGRLVLHPRALQGIKRARFDDVELAYKALLLLGNEYRDMRKGLLDQSKFQESMQELGLRCSGSISVSRAGEQGETYFVRWPIGSDTRAFLELHLRKGIDKDERLTLATYFFWDEDSQQVVVGWLPSHLENRMT